MERLKSFVPVTFIAFLLTFVVLPAGISSAQEITLNWASFVPKTHPETVSLQKGFFDVINERGKGKVLIKYRGGPETLPERDLGDAVNKGIVDFGTALCTFYQEIVPGAAITRFSPFEPSVERQNGVYDWLDAHHMKYGIKYMGRCNPSKGGDTYFYTYLNKKPMKPEDFKGLRIGAAGSGRPAVEAMGAGVVTLKLSEYYTSMERNLVDGIVSVPLAAWVAWGIHEKTKYVIDHPYFQATGLLIGNLKSWNKLPKDVQSLIMGRMIEFEKEALKWEIEKEQQARQAMAKAGAEFYKFSPEMVKWYYDKLYTPSWQHEEKRFGQPVRDFKELLEKAKAKGK